MSKSNSYHLTLEDRIQIQRFIHENKSMREIGRILGFSASTISRELRIHRHIKNGTSFNNQNPKSLCVNSRLITVPWICPGCASLLRCKKMKYFYYADKAHPSYLNTLIDSRRKLHPSEDAFTYFNVLLTPLISTRGQSLDHVYSSHGETIGISKSTLYRYIDKGYLDIKNHHLPRRIRYKAVRVKKCNESKPTTARIHRTYLDFLSFPNHILKQV